MRPRLGARLVAVGVLALALSACEMTVGLRTVVGATGAGSFTLSMSLDRELVEQLSARPEQTGDGLAAIRALFDGLEVKGWSVVRLPREGGLVLDATRRFANHAGFERALGELRTARTGGRSRLANVRLELGYRTHRSFLRRSTEFSGTIDTRGGAALDPATVRALGDLVHFEVQADLPGTVGGTTGDAAVSKTRVTWRPALGTASTFAARASTLRTGPLLATVSLLLAAAAAVARRFLRIRRSRERISTGAE